MTVLDLDPPQSLRLVASTGDSVARDHRYRSGAGLVGDARRLYREILQAALAWGEAVNPDALRVILATKQATHASPIRHLSASRVWQLMMVDVVTWCRNRHLTVPDGCAAALTLAVTYLHTSETLDETSDEVEDLYDAIDECTGGWSEPSTGPSHPARPRSLRSSRGSKRT